MFALNYKSVKDQINILGCTRRTFSMLTGISERHIYRLEKYSIKLNSNSQRVIKKIEELCNVLVEIFGRDEKKIYEWLNKPNESLNNITPIRYIMSAHSELEGIERVIDLLRGFKLGITG